MVAKTRPFPYCTVHITRLVGAGAGQRRFELAVVQRVIVPGGGQHVIAARRLHLHAGVELVLRLQEALLEPARDRVIAIGEGDGEVVNRRVLRAAVIVAAAHARELGPVFERGGRVVIHHQALPAAHEIEKHGS